MSFFSAENFKKMFVGNLIFTGVVATIAGMLHGIWLEVGDSQWELKEERDGIKIWTSKTPGHLLLKGKAEFHVDTTLGAFAKVSYDPEVHKAESMPPITMIGEPTRTPGSFSAFNSFVQELPGPFTDREFVLISGHKQDLETKAIEFNVIAAPTKTPPNDCCIRILQIHNRYVITPLESGGVNFQFFWNMDLGGATPYFIQNMMLVDTIFTAMEGFRNTTLKYKDAKFEHILELGEESTATQAASM